jgi:hypothetical protein
MQAQKTGTWPFGGPFTYIEDVFSTYLYTGTGATQTITNGIDLAGKGGLVWTKSRIEDGNFHSLFDTNRGTLKRLVTNTTFAETSIANSLQSFNSNGFSVGSSGTVNASTYNYVSWTFRKQPKFFDVVTYTGDGSALKTISHNLGSVPGCIIVKSTSSASWNWTVYHRSLGISQKIQLNLTDAAVSENGNFGGTSPTSTAFSVGYNATNESGGTYVAYIFAHDAGGFGASATDNVISCGSFTTDGSGNATVSLGYEPQWVLIKRTNGADSWYLNDNMRGMAVSGNQPNLSPNLSAAESAGGYNTYPNATGFTASVGIASAAHIYIAIRRGPMKTPTLGTSVFAPVVRTGTSASATITGVGFPPDLVTSQDRGATGTQPSWQDRLRGANKNLRTNSTAAETSPTQTLMSFDMDGATLGTAVEWNYSGEPFVNYFLRRAPSFFDEVCYTGNDAFNRAITHNLAAVPELVITKVRSTTSNWAVYSATTGVGFPMALNTTAAAGANPYVWGSTVPTNTNFYVGDDTRTNGGGFTYVSYLFATCPGVSKVGSYTGNGTTQTINCGFTGGARFVLIKRTDAIGDWYTYDTARGMTVLTDPYLWLNSNNPEVATLGSVTSVATGFALDANITAAINASGGSYIFFAIS